MPRSERFRSADWRAWIALAWAVWFGLLYVRTVVDARGGKLRAAASAVAPGSTR